MVPKIGLFWQFQQISGPVLAPGDTYTKSGPGPRSVTLVSCWLLSLFHHCLQPVQVRVCQKRCTAGTEQGVSVSGFASGRWLRCRRQCQPQANPCPRQSVKFSNKMFISGSLMLSGLHITASNVKLLDRDILVENLVVVFQKPGSL